MRRDTRFKRAVTQLVKCPQCKWEGVRLFTNAFAEYYHCRACGWSDIDINTGTHDEVLLEYLRRVNPGVIL